MRDEGVSSAGAMARRKAEIAVWADIRAFPPLAVIAGLDCLAALVLWRKFSGGPPLVLTNARLCLAGLIVGALVVAGRWWLVRIEHATPAVWLRAILMALAVLPMLALLSLASSRHSPWAVSFTGSLVVVSGGTVLLWNRTSPTQTANVQSRPREPHARPLTTNPVAVSCPAETAHAVPTTSKSTVAAHRAGNSTTAADDARRDEWLERVTDESGAVIVRGQALASFAAGQSIAIVHVPFCPALARIPQFICDVDDAPSVRPRAPAVFRYGARIELKRTGDTSHTARVRVRFSATVRANSSRAA